MSKIIGIENMTTQELNSELDRGAKFVLFSYTVSVLIMTFKRPTDIYFIRGGESHWKYSWKYTLLSLVAGWWGFPWGFIYTPWAVISNISGGKNITAEVLGHFNSQTGEAEVNTEAMVNPGQRATSP